MVVNWVLSPGNQPYNRHFQTFQRIKGRIYRDRLRVIDILYPIDFKHFFHPVLLIVADLEGGAYGLFANPQQF